VRLFRIAAAGTFASGAWHHVGNALYAFWGGSVRISWILVAVAAPLLTAACTLGPFIYASPAEIFNRAFGIAQILFIAIVFAGIGWRRLSLTFESFALMIAVALTVPGLTTVIASLGMPYQDAALLATDRALGFDWQAIVEWVRDRPTLSIILSHIYPSLVWQPILLFPLAAFIDPERLRRILGASTLALLITILCFIFVPAQTGYVYLGYKHADFPAMLTNTSWGVAEIIEAVRAGERHLSFDGLVTFPSYHATGAVLLAFGWLAVPILRWFFVPLNVAMLLSCVPIGSHYVIDVIAGSLLAPACYLLTDRYYRLTDRLPPLRAWRDMPHGGRLASLVELLLDQARTAFKPLTIFVRASA
jgi:membrane-associated phospholipid phosphatase